MRLSRTSSARIEFELIDFSFNQSVVLGKRKTCYDRRFVSFNTHNKALSFADLAGSDLLKPSVELFACAHAQHLGKLLNEVVGQIDFWMKLPKRDERFLFIGLQFAETDEGRGTSPAERTEEMERGRIRGSRSSSLLEASEQAAHTPTHTIGCNHGPPVLDITGLYYGTQLPTVRGERAGVNQDRSYAAEIVVRETRHGPTSARPWHGLSQPGKPRPSARSRASVRSRRAGSERGAPLASPASAVLHYGLNFGDCLGCTVSRGLAPNSSVRRVR
jgi:hypothetical protein